MSNTLQRCPNALDGGPQNIREARHELMILPVLGLVNMAAIGMTYRTLQ